jgi:serine/threonine-protein kinase
MAAVHRAVDLTQEDPSAAQVALKVMHEHLAGDATFVRRFRREAKAAAALRHPHSVRIVDYGIDGTMAYIAMELLVGQDLFQLIKHDGALAGRRAAEIMIQVCDALTAAHSRGILHRDLKPENVMLVRGATPGEEMVKVLDFGVAKIVASEHRIEDAPTNITGTGLTSVGAVLGTPEYMSPEQCQGEPLDFRSDIYACGVLLYQLVTGQVPFSGETPVHTMLLHVREPPQPPRALAPALDAAIEAVILRALAKRPGDRFPDAQQLGSALAQAIGRKVPWVPTDIGPPEAAFAATPTPTGIPHLRSLGVALPPRAATQAPSAYDETVHADDEPRPRAGASTAPLPTPPAPPRPARHTVPLHAPDVAAAPSAPPPAMPEASTNAPGAPGMPRRSGPPAAPHVLAAAHPAPNAPAPFSAMGGLGSTHVMPSASVPEIPAGPPRPALPTAPRAMAPSPGDMGGGALVANPFAAAARGDTRAAQRSFAFHAVTFAVAFVVVLVTLTLIVFR